MEEHMQILMRRYPSLRCCEEQIRAAVELLIRVYENKGKLLLCGNGGSCADCDHIVGELMKGFLLRRPLSCQEKQQLRGNGSGMGKDLAEYLQRGLPAVSLCAFSALETAYANDVKPEFVFAQQAFVLGNSWDALLGISTSGNSVNIIAAAQAARSKDMYVLGLTGAGGGRLAALADVCIMVPETETFRVQELHLPVYHCICAMLEEYFFAGQESLKSQKQPL